MRRVSRVDVRALVAGCALALLVVAVSWWVHQQRALENARTQRSTEGAALGAVRESVDGVLAHERTLADLVAVSPGVAQARWLVLARVVMGDPAASGTGLIVPVPERDRAVFERVHRLRLLTSPTPGAIVPAPHRGLHLVLEQYAQRVGSAGPVLGMDLAGNPLRHALLLRAARTGAQVATPPVRFLNRGGGTGVIVFDPVRVGSRVLGWVTASYTAQRLLAAVGQRFPGARLSVRDGSDRLVVGTGSRRGVSGVVAVADRRWTVTAWVPAAPGSTVAWLVLALGLALSAGVVLMLRAAGARERYALARVHEHLAIEDQHLAEIESQHQELAKAQRIARLGSWSWDPIADVADWSDELYRIFARDPGRGPLVGEEFFAYIHPDDRERIKAGYEMGFGGVGNFELDYRIICEDGEERFVHGICHLDPDGCYVGTLQDLSALRTAEEDARSQRELAERIVEGAHDAIVVADHEGRIVGWNPAAEALFGYRAQEVIGCTIAETIVPERLRDPHRAGLTRAAAGGPASVLGRPLTLPALDSSGRELTIEMTIASLPSSDGPVFTAVIRDASERERHQHEQALLAAIVRQSEDAIIVKDRDGLIVEWNAGAERLYGYRASEIVGQPIARLMPPDRAGEARELLERALAGESVSAFETTRVHQDGHLVEVSLSISPLRDGAGEITGASVIAHDVTARVRAERARRDAEERLRVTVEHAPIGVALVDLAAGGRFVSVNQSVCRITGQTPEALVEMTLASIIHPDDTPGLMRELTLLATDAQARTEHELRLLHGDGRFSWALLTGAAIPEPGRAHRYAVVHLLDIGERKRFEGQLQHLADHDALTGLYNRRRFESELERALAHAERYDSRGAVLLIDLDGFKYVNDTMGHSYGDELVTRIGGLLRGALRETDVIARLGGDEFAVIVTGAGQAEGVAVAEKLLQALRDRAIVLSDQRHARVSASVGCTTFTSRGGLSAEELIAEADIAMYDAKEHGRNQVATYERDGARHDGLIVRESWLARLQAAIAEEQFELYAQPIKGICSHGVERFELLLRLRGDEDELIPPGTFLYVAEQFDLIQQIDRWVFAQAVNLLREQHANGHDVSLSVNMSGKTLGDPQIIQDITAILERSPVAPDRLIVEVTETAAIVNIDKARDVARALRGLGCQFALDDFGAGFASFYYLKHLDFDYLKIDGEFIKTLATDPTDQLVVKSVVDIARGLGAKTIAEFVGDDYTVNRLLELGVDYGQGYHLGHPAPVRQLIPIPTD